MPSPNYTSLWEAFTSGQFGEGYQYGTPFEQESDYGERTGAFFEQAISPAFNLGEDAKAGLSPTPFDPMKMQQAEEQFRMSIGDPYTGGGTDPFAWETISRYDTPAEAQKLLEGELYGAGGELGGTTGAEYGTGLAKSKEAYGTGLTGKREGITYGDLMSDVAQQSGTSGMVLRSGSAAAQSENILAEAYKGAKTLGAEHLLEKEEVQTSLEKNLSDALTDYMNVLDTEKEAWYQDILSEVAHVRDVTPLRAEGEFTPLTEWEQGKIYDPEEEFPFREEYRRVEGKFDRPTVEGFEPPEKEYGACGPGELYDEASQQCVSIAGEDIPIGEGVPNLFEDIEIPDPIIPGPESEDVYQTPAFSSGGEEEIFDFQAQSVVPTTATVEGLPSLREGLGQDVSSLFRTMPRRPSTRSRFRTKPRSPFGRGRRRRGRRSF